MTLQDFVQIYEKESLQLGTTARQDVIMQIMTFFPEDDGLTSQSHAKAASAVLVLAGNTSGTFHHRLRNIELVALVNALHTSPVLGLVGIDLRYNHLGEEEDNDLDAQSGTDEGEREFLLATASSLGRLLQPPSSYSNQITELNLQGNRLGSESCRLLCTALDAAGMTSPLRRLNLNGNPLGSKGGHAIAALLSNSTCLLEELNLGNTELDVSNLITIAQSLRVNCKLKALNLDNPVIRTKEEEAIQYLGKALQVNQVLTSLSLAKHQMTDRGAQALAERLLDNCCLRVLVLRANQIGSQGASALAASLLRHPTLAHFDLSANRIGDAGAKSFAKVLRANMEVPLEVLSLCFTNIADEGLRALAEACERPENPNVMSRLRCLFLWGNSFGSLASPLFLQLCEPGGRFQQCRIETDFAPYRVDQQVFVAYQETKSFRHFSSSKR